MSTRDSRSDDRLIAEFVAAVAALHIDDRGVWNLPAELEVTARLALAVQRRIPSEPTPQQRALFDLANTVRMIVKYVGVYMKWLESLDSDYYGNLTQRFFAQRAALADVLPPIESVSADTVDGIEPSADAVRHNGRWHDPRFEQVSNASDPLA